MGLTIHYDLKSNTRRRKTQSVATIVEGMRQLALDLPFERVDDETKIFEGSRANPDNWQGEAYEAERWLLIQSAAYVSDPADDRYSYRVNPTTIVAFAVYPGPGCEPLNIGLCRYPQTIHKPNPKRGWDLNPREILTKLHGWRWSSFCKTQYANDPRSGGMPNFLRCHVSAITLLDRIAKLPTMSVHINDEGDYGPNHSSRDWKEAQAEGRDPVYKDWPGYYDVKKLANEVGNWDTMIAGFLGGMTDAAEKVGAEGSHAMQGRPNFEHLEAIGANNEDLIPFLNQCAAIVKEKQNDG